MNYKGGSHIPDVTMGPWLYCVADWRGWGSMFSDESEEQQERGSAAVRTSEDPENTVSKNSRASTFKLFSLDIQPENQDLWANAG